MMLKLPIEQLTRDGRRPPLPVQQTEGAAALDLTAFLPAPLTVPAGGRALVPTGLRVAVPQGYGGFILARSGLALRSGITMANGVGLIDSDYRGELCVPVLNTSDVPFTVCDGDRIAQFLVLAVPALALVPCDGLDETARGAGGFGSTGVGERTC